MFVRQFKLTIAALLSLLILPFAGCGGSDSDTGNDFLLPYSNFDAPVRLAFQTVPMRVSGTTFSAIQVAVLDYNGKVVTTADNAITIALANPGGATLMGTLTRNAVNGIATFDDLSVDIVGTYTFVASSPGLLGASSTNFEITPASPAQLTFPAQPGDINSGDTLGTVQVEVRDAQGNLVDTTVTLTLQAVSGSGTLGGTTSQATTNGVASFSDLTVTGGGTFTLQAAVSTGAMAASNQFMVSGLISNFLVTDQSNQRIASFDDLTGTNWTTLSAGSVNIYGVTADGAGRIYYSDYSNQRIVRVDDISGANMTTFGSAGSGINQFNNPYNTVFDNQGRLLIADFNNNRVVRIDDISGANWTTLTGMSGPFGLAVDASDRIYVSEYGSNRIRRFDDINGTNPFTLNLGYAPGDIALDGSGRIYVTHINGGSISRYDDISGANRVDFGTLGTGVNQFSSLLYGIRVSSTGQIVVCDTNNRRICVFDDMTGTNFTTFGSSGSGVNQFGTIYQVFLGN